ncbi:MAG: hypothetical protein WC467_00930 [Patescibacteria group bacterium]
MKNTFWYLIIASFSLWALDEIFLFRPDFFFVSLGLALLIIAYTVRALVKKGSQKFWPIYIVAPAVFYLSFSFYSAIISSHVWIQLIFLLNAWFVYSYLKNIYYHFSFSAPEREIKLRRLLISGAFLSTFALAANLYGLTVFLNWPFILLLASFIILSIFIFGQFFMFQTKSSHDERLFLGLNVLILAEFAGVFFFLPLNYNVLGLLVAIIFYLLLLFNEWREENRLDFKNLKWPIIITTLIFIVVLLTARWL